MTPKEISYQNQATTIIKALEKRNMSGHFFNTSKEAVDFITNFIQDNSVVTWGGSVTLSEIGLLQRLEEKPLTLLDRGKASTKEEVQKIYREANSADYYLMSTNAITLDGKLINIDGNSNRISSLIFGPKQVLVIAGMNKVAIDEASAIERVHNFAAPANAVRLKLTTPCATTGICHKCLSDDCICCNTVITRKSRHDDRIHVILIGEELGY